MWPLLSGNLPKQVKLKASGGIRTLADGGSLSGTGSGPSGRQCPGGRPGSRDEGRRCPAAAGCARARQGAGAAAGAVSPAHSPAPQPPAGAQRLPDPGAERSLLIDTGFGSPRAASSPGRAACRRGGARSPGCAAHPFTPTTPGWPEVVRPGAPSISGGGTIPSPAGPGRRNTGAALTSGFSRRLSPEELRITTGTNPARTLGPDLTCPLPAPGGQGDRLTVGEYTLEVIAAPGHTPGSDLPVDGRPAGPLHRGPCSL